MQLFTIYFKYSQIETSVKIRFPLLSARKRDIIDIEQTNRTDIVGEMEETHMKNGCHACPRNCGIDRSLQTGFCGVGGEIRIARAAKHPWEEPCISGKSGSGTVFFCGCNLRCVFCQNREISRDINAGRTVTAEELSSILLRLRDEGVENINLVTPTHYVMQLIPVLRELRPRLGIPIVYNCGGYESVEALRALDGLIDVYLPDAKYFSPALSSRYSAAPDYFQILMQALHEMLRQTGAPRFDENGMLTRGVIVRHLVLPGCRKDSIDLLRALHAEFGRDAFLLSLMSQYTPEFAPANADKNLRRRLTSFEYESVQSVADELGFSGYLQERASASAAFTPDFSQTSL